MPLLWLVLGFTALIVGAESLVRGAARLAARFGVSPLIVGLTIVSVGTGAPEIATALLAGLEGHGDIAVGNLVGSNVFNVLFILGLVSLIAPLVVAQRLVRIDVPLLIGVSVWVAMLAADGTVSRGEGIVLLLGFVAYMLFCLYEARYESPAVLEEYAREFGAPPATMGVLRDVVSIGLGMGLLVLGSRWAIDGAVDLGRAMGVSELVIGLTIIAAGTGLPEVVTSAVAALRGERDIAVGNVVGSNLCNLLLALGALAIVVPDGAVVAPAARYFDMPVMVAAAVACLPIFATGFRIARWEGGLMLAYYVAYVVYLVLDAQTHDMLPAYSAIMLWFVVPLTVATLSVVAVRAWRDVRAAS